ncbi:MAG: CorA family divalent cation transporter [Candidatus Altarchaeum sp.]|nr:CorA family divalent cation transporter [Candidatus Altarchaeum sp.]
MKIFKYLGNGQISVIEAEKISLDELKDSWLDLKTDDLPEDIFGMKIEKGLLNEDEYCQIEDSTNYTLVKISYIGKNNVFKTIYFFVISDAIITIHKEESTPINHFIKNINAIIKDEKENIIKFNNFVLAQLLYEIVDKNMDVISTIDDHLQNLRNSVEKNSMDLNIVNKIRDNIKTFSRVLLYQSVSISYMKRGEGEYISKKDVEYYTSDILAELDKYGKLSTGLEKELNGIISAIESKNLTEYTKYTARLSIAIELLTRASVLFMIPNSIFTLWPSIYPQNALLFGLPNWTIEILIATISIIFAQLIISYIYRIYVKHT